MKHHDREQGFFTIEAILALSIFMFCFISFISLALVARAESTTQYAINQVAKEISRYYYIVSKVGLTTPGDALNDLDDVIGSIVTLAGTTDQAAGNVSNAGSQLSSGDLANFDQVVQSLSDDIDAVSGAVDNLQSSLAPFMDDPVGMIMLLGRDIAGEAVNKVVAQMMCKALTPKYITSNGDPDETLKNWGVVGGLGGLDFRMSSFLADGHTINIVLVYQLKVTGFGVIDKDLVIVQTACTSAWLNKTTRAGSPQSGLLAAGWSDYYTMLDSHVFTGAHYQKTRRVVT